MNIAEIEGETKGIDVTVKIVSLKQAETKKSSSQGVYYYGILGDETGTMPFTAWNFPTTLRQGDIVEIRNCSVGKYNDSLRIYVDSRSEVLLKPEAEMNVKRVYRNYKIKNITPKDLYISVEGKVSDVIKKNYEKDGSSREVTYFTLSDDTGSIRVSSFGREIKEGVTVRIEGAKVSEYNGRYRLTIFENTPVIMIDKAFDTGKTYDISDVNGPVDQISLAGFAIAISDRSGLLRRCNTCRKMLDDVRCPDHPDDGFFLDLFASFILTDGSGEMHSTCGKAVLSKLLSLGEQDLDPMKTRLTKREVLESLKKALYGRPFLMKGDAVQGENNLNYRVKEITELDEKGISKLLLEMEADLA